MALLDGLILFAGKFVRPLRLESLPDGRTWRLLEDFSYSTDDGATIRVPAGFITDLASIPRVLWRLLPPIGRYNRAAVIHDFLYAQHRGGSDAITREQADGILYEAMTDSGVDPVTRWLVWAGVRIGGWAAWARR
jgi:hypothetical protein